jgi:formyl-CoA transferase
VVQRQCGEARTLLPEENVVAFEQAVSMPFCSFILAELGAEVVKVERPGGGDVIRGWDHVARGLSSGFVWLNANKRDLAVDARQPEGRDIVRVLADHADVFVENFSPGVVERLGLSSDELRRRNPRLIYCSLSGYGQTGPYREKGGFDFVAQGMSGLMSMTGEPDRRPMKSGIAVYDIGAGITAVYSILAAYIHRQRTGEGQHIDVAMAEFRALRHVGRLIRFWIGAFGEDIDQPVSPGQAGEDP